MTQTTGESSDGEIHTGEFGRLQRKAGQAVHVQRNASKECPQSSIFIEISGRRAHHLRLDDCLLMSKQ